MNKKTMYYNDYKALTAFEKLEYLATAKHNNDKHVVRLQRKVYGQYIDTGAMMARVELVFNH